MLGRDDPSVSLAHQCRLLGVSHMAAYRQRAVSEADLDLMRRMDAMHMESPTMGARQFAAQLRLDGIAAGRNRVQRLMHIMSIQHVAPPPKTSAAAPGWWREQTPLRFNAPYRLASREGPQCVHRHGCKDAVLEARFDFAANLSDPSFKKVDVLFEVAKTWTDTRLSPKSRPLDFA